MIKMSFLSVLFMEGKNILKLIMAKTGNFIISDDKKIFLCAYLNNEK